MKGGGGSAPEGVSSRSDTDTKEENPDRVYLGKGRTMARTFKAGLRQGRTVKGGIAGWKKF